MTPTLPLLSPRIMQGKRDCYSEVSAISDAHSKVSNHDLLAK